MSQYFRCRRKLFLAQFVKNKYYLWPILSQTTPMNTRIAKKLVSDLPLNINDIARLVLKMAERLGAATEGLSKVEMMGLLRRVGEEGVRAVSFEEAARASLEARRDRRPTTQRDLRHFIGRMLRVEGVAARPLRAMGVAECKKLLEKPSRTATAAIKKGVRYSAVSFHTESAMNGATGPPCKPSKHPASKKSPSSR